jgi:DNA modification methylase
VVSIIHGDCLAAMAAMEPESVDAIVTDPPYGLEFMGKEWDRLDGGFAKGGSSRFHNSPPLPSYGTKGPAMQQFHQQNVAIAEARLNGVQMGLAL